MIPRREPLAARPAEPPRWRPDVRRQRALEMARNRLLATGLIFALAFVVMAFRLVDLTAFDARTASAGRAAATSTAVSRADIFDRNGTILATSLPTASVYADPKNILDVDAAVRDLASVFPDLDRKALAARLQSDGRFVWVRRSITPDEKYKVNRLGIPGIDFMTDHRRVYPSGPAAAHALGFTDIDGRGIAGVEQSFDAQLAAGQPLHLSLDIRLQQLLRQELEASRREYGALGAAGIVLDALTGEVLAMVSLPDFDPNAPVTDPNDEARFNRITKGVYEMGSTFKILTLAMALDCGATSLRGGYDASRPLRVARFTISDYHPKNRWLSTPEILIYSSNIGSALMGMDVGPARQKQYLQRLGFLSRASLEVPELAMPLYPEPWRDINTMTIAFGHGIAVTPLHLVTAVGAVVDGGILRPATLLRKREGTAASEGTQVLSPRTSRQMAELMRMVVEYGTGTRADVPGYEVGGKTGTAEKLNRGRYVQNARISSFVGAFPMSNPRFVVLAMLDEPKSKGAAAATGGVVAAPVVARIVRQMAPLLGLAPQPAAVKPDPGTSSVKDAKRAKPPVRDAIVRIQGKQFAAN
jgi:cell division protein FtsI (penicillin-binding protein 3)